MAPRSAKNPPVETKPKALTRKQLEFLDDWLASFPRNATQSYAKVYGSKLSTAAVEGSKLLKKPHIVAEIERRESPNAAKSNLSAARIREEVAAVGFSDVRHYVINDDGTIGLAPDAPPDAMRAVSRVKMKRRTIPQGRDAQGNPLPPIVEIEAEVNLWDKPTALRLGAQVRGLLVKRAPVGPDGLPVPPGGAVPSSIEIILVDSEDGKPKRRGK